MLRFYRTLGGRMAETGGEKDARFIRAVTPTDAEISCLSACLNMKKDVFYAALDEDSVPRVEMVEGAVLLVCASPVSYRQDEDTRFGVFPFAVLFTGQMVVALESRDNPMVYEWLQRFGSTDGSISRLVSCFLQLLAGHFERHLHQIEKIVTYLEKQAGKSPRNRRLRELLGLEASLVHYSAALRENEAMLKTLLCGRYLPLTVEDRARLESVHAEMGRMGELALAYTNLLDGTIGTMSSIISNNLNRMLRIFSVVLILLAGVLGVLFVFGLHTSVFPVASVFFVLAVSAVCMSLGGILLHQSLANRQACESPKTGI